MGVSIWTKRGLLLPAAIGAAVFASGTAQAATQGNLGATSTGSVEIRASVPNRARISGLSDVSWVNQNPSTVANAAQNVCVWSNTATKRYSITAIGSGPGNAFSLANGALRVNYSVRWSGATGAVNGTVLTSGAASATFTSSATQQLCASGPAASSSLIVRIGVGQLSRMQSQTTYTGVLTLIVTPN